MLTKIYKPGQGKYTRLCSGLVVATIVAFGCWRLYERLGATDLSLWVISLVPSGTLTCAIVTPLSWIMAEKSVT